MKIYTADINGFTESEYNFAFSLLCESRKAEISEKRIKNDKIRSVLGEYLAKKAVSELTGTQIDEIVFSKTANGKPYCVNCGVHFSISHSKELVVCAADEFNIGIDVEFIRQIDMGVTRFACNEKDIDFVLSALDEDEKIKRFFMLWTAKEAYIKFCGGVLADLKSIDYNAVKDNCEFRIAEDYMIAVYRNKNE